MEEVAWKEYSKTLKKVLKLKGSPVAVRFTDEPKERGKGKASACKAMHKARDGETYVLNKETSICPGGTVYLGLCEPFAGERDKWLKNFLVNGEKFYCSFATFHRARQHGTPPLTGLTDYVVFCPLAKSKEAPDLVLFICNPEQACRLLHLSMYWHGVPPKTMQTGAACSMAISYPINSGEINISFLDWTARKWEKYSPNELIVSVPFDKMHGIIEAIPHSSAGTAKVEMPVELAVERAE